MAGTGGGRASRLLGAAGWMVVAASALVALARLVAWDARSILVSLNAVAPLVYLPLWAVAIAAGMSRRWRLLLAATPVLLTAASFVLPELLAADALPAGAAVAPRLRLFDANVFEGRGDVDGYAAELDRARPDVVVLQEATPGFLARLDATGALRDLPHRVTVARTDPFAALVASRWPLTEEDVVSVRGRPTIVRATLDVGGRQLRLLAVHTVAPVGGYRQDWVQDLQEVAAAVGREGLPVLVAGDFNATWGHRGFRRLLDSGLADAAAARAKPYDLTWPRNHRLVPPLVRIDHVLTTRQLAVLRIGTGVGRGSDHRPLVADVAIL